MSNSQKDAPLRGYSSEINQEEPIASSQVFELSLSFIDINKAILHLKEMND